jgi:NADPH-dependent 2,4-dienoyl-CoA reductase/sulfur reductase-like enzyme/nitrite reductase/ring-hydroxylating ferredoxin subunit
VRSEVEVETRIGRFEDLPDGVPVQVKAAGRPVLVIRLGDELHALPARCTHRPRPLGGGLLHGGRLMCPSHQAAFDVRTGDALEPPALDALVKYAVEVRDGDVYVEIPEGATGRRPMPMWPYDPERDRRTFAIVGAGGAGAVAAETLRQAGYQGRILLISREAHLPYDRPNCSVDYLTGKVHGQQLALRSGEFYEHHHIERRHAEVSHLDVPLRAIDLSDGERLRPDAILIATGGTPRLLPVPGADLEGVLVLRSWDDSDAVIAAAEESSAAVVIGAGFIGLEVATGLRRRGLDVTVVAPEALPLGPLLGERIGYLVRDVHETAGVRFELGHTVAALAGGDRVETVRLDDGRELPAQLVVIGIGVRPATRFVDGLPLADDGGIEVDEQLRAAPGVWAAGDVARYPDTYSGSRVRIEHWRTAQQHGKAAALSMAGKGEPFTGVPFFWTHQHRLGLAFVGYLGGWDEVVFDGDVESGDFIAFFFAAGRLRGAGGTRGDRLGAFAELMRSHALPPAAHLRRHADLDLVQLLREAPPPD